MTWPISWSDVEAARARIKPYLAPSPLRHYATLDAELGVRVLVKHDNHLPTNAFKARNAMSFMTALPAEQRAKGVVAATRGNHGAGLAWAGELSPVVAARRRDHALRALLGGQRGHERHRVARLERVRR